MDLVFAISQGLGLAVAAGFFASAPLAVAASVAALGFADGSLRFAGDPLTVAVLWVVAAIELVADAIWPGAEAGARLLRRVVGGGLAFELVAGHRVPFVGLAVGAGVAAAVALTLRQMRIRAIRGGGDVRGTAIVEDGAGVMAAAVGAIPLVGFLLTVAAALLFSRTRRSDQEKYKGLRVLR
jgi:iron complex transport system permease protein